MITKIGIVGCGTIGSQIAQAVKRDFSKHAKISALYDIDLSKAEKLALSLGVKNPVVKSLKALIEKCDLVIEAASGKISAGVASAAIKHKKDCMIMSVGGLLSAPEIFNLARKNACSIYIPSGAICGLDGLKAHRLANIRKVMLTTRKPPKALTGAPYIIEKKIDLGNIKSETEIFKGTAQEAVKYFPQNINVAAALSLCGIGKEKTMVRIVSSPDYTGNTHEIEIESDAGRTFIRCENYPSPDNPKTSYLAILSAIATLRGIFESVKVGT